jgi:hypothetical protein
LKDEQLQIEDGNPLGEGDAVAPESVRLHLQLTPKMGALLVKLIEKTGVTTRAEVIRRALSVYAFLNDEISQGHKVAIIGPDETRVLILP